ncbi:MAG: glycoside hydrolase family 5 protein [Acidobacteriaceae bacterium]
MAQFRGLLALRISVYVLALLFAVTTLQAQAAKDANSLAFARSAELARGINLSGWFGGTGDFSAHHLESGITPRDLALIHNLGFQYVRLGVDPRLVINHGVPAADAAQNLQLLDHAVDEIRAAHLSVMITVFPNEEYKQTLQNQRGVDDFVMLWRMLAQHFVGRDPDHIFFELMNEPEVQDLYRWMGIQARVDFAIRQADTQHTIIATAGRWSSLDDLLGLEPVSDPNVIYNFHFYEPYPFTHQSASWGSSEWLYYKDVMYPATPETLQAAIARVPDALARYSLFLYAATGWNQKGIEERLAFAADWARSRHVPLICNEFGAYRDTAPADSRARWIHDVRSSLQKLHIGWAMWDYNGNFGLVREQNGNPVPDAAVVQALGLHLESSGK